MAIRSALLLGPAGEFAFVTMGQATGSGVISPEAGAFITTMTALSMATVPILDKLGGWIAGRIEKKAAPDPELTVAPPVASGKRVIVVGYGRVGQLVCEHARPDTRSPSSPSITTRARSPASGDRATTSISATPTTRPSSSSAASAMPPRWC